MEEAIFLLILTIVGVIMGFVLDHFGLSKYKDTKDLIIKALEDKKITKDEILAILNQFEQDLKE